MRRILRTLLLKVSVAALVLGLALLLLRSSGSFLVVDNREKSDVMVITQGDSLDAQYWMALHLLQEGYGRELLLDARTNLMLFGRSQADVAEDFIHQSASRSSGRVRVCRIAGATTAQEVYEAATCLKESRVRTVLLVVDDYHSRRSLAMFSRLMPRYQWSIAAVPDSSKFEPLWWRKREWIRTTVVEWQHLLWWELIDRWRFRPQTGAGQEQGGSGF